MFYIGFDIPLSKFSTQSVRDLDEQFPASRQNLDGRVEGGGVKARRRGWENVMQLCKTASLLKIITG